MFSIIGGGCKKNSDNHEVIVLDDNILQVKDTLNPHLIPVNVDNTTTDYFIMVNDSIVINHKSSGNYVDVFNRNTGKNMSSYFNVGEGPDEMLFCQLISNGRDIIATDYIRKQFYQIPIDSLTHPNFHPTVIKYPSDVNLTSHPLQVEDSIILINPFHYINPKAGINQNVPRFYKTAINQQTIGGFEKVEYMTHNVGQVYTIRDQTSGNLWVVPLNNSYIDIYDSSLKLKKTILFPSEIGEGANVVVKESSTGKEVTYKGGYPLGFTGAVISNDNSKIYLCYIGKFIGINDNEKDYPTYIIVMNWNGESIETHLVSKFVFSLSVVESNIYATVEDEEENRILVKLNYE